jgi:hypothetical protein
MLRFILPSLLTGCQLTKELESLQEDLGKLTNDFIISGFFVGAEEFQYAGIDMSELEDVQVVQSTVYLATADVTGESDPAPISRATVKAVSNTLNIEFGERLDTNPARPGEYYTNSEGGLVYTPEELVTIDATQDGNTHSVSVMTPLPADLNLADSFPATEGINHEQNTEMIIDITGQGFDGALIGVLHFPFAAPVCTDPAYTNAADCFTAGEEWTVEMADPQVVYSNEPTTFQELYDLSHPSDEGNVGLFTIPGDNFDDDGIYIISVGGVIAADTVDMIDMNTVFSSLLAAQMNFEAVCIAPINDQTGEPICP